MCQKRENCKEDYSGGNLQLCKANKLLPTNQQPLKTETKKQAIFYGDSSEHKKSAM